MANLENRNEPSDLKGIYVRSNKGEMIQLDNLITMDEQSNPPQLFRFNRYVSATISAGTSPGISLGQGIDAMRSIATEVLDDNYSTDLSGPSKEFAGEFFYAIICIYFSSFTGVSYSCCSI